MKWRMMFFLAAWGRGELHRQARQQSRLAESSGEHQRTSDAAKDRRRPRREEGVLFAPLLGGLLLLMLAGLAPAQSPPPLALPDLDLRANGEVRAIARQPDGGVVFGGFFDSVDDVPRQNIARLLPDGTLDPEWNPSANFFVDALAVDASGAVYAGGSFSQIGGVLRNRIAKLSGSGTGAADPDWNPSANNQVFALTVDTSGAVYAGGSFSQVGGASRSFIAKLSGNSTGAADPDWNPSANNTVRALAVDATGAVYAGGDFTQIGGAARSHIAKLPGSGTGAADPDWNPSANNQVGALAVDASGAVYAGGSFSQIGGALRSYIAKLWGGGTGAADPAWNPSANSFVVALTVDASGAVYAGGLFTQIGGASRNFIAKLSGNGAGVADPVWNPSANGFVDALTVDASGSVVAGGRFTQIAGQPQAPLVRLDSSGELAAVQAAVERPGRVDTMATQPDGGLIVGGFFSKANEQPRLNLLRLRPDRSLDPDWNPSANSEVRALAVDASGAVYAGGLFTQIGGASRNFIAKLSGNGAGVADPTWNPSANSSVIALAMDTSGAVYAGGVFSQIGGVVRNSIAKLSGDGTGEADPVWDPSANGGVYALAVDASGPVYVGGIFTQIGGAARSNIAKLSGSGTGAADPGWSPSANNLVRALAVDTSGAVYVGGLFTQIGGASRSFIAKLPGSGTGAADPVWNPSASFEVSALAVDASGEVYAGGAFSQIGGASRDFIAKLSGSGTGSADPDWNPSANNTVTALAVIDSGAVYVGGYFTQIGGQPRAGLAALPAASAVNPPPLALPDLDLRAGGEVYAVVRQPDGGVVFGGAFDFVNDIPRQNIARLLPDGTLDPDWNPSANGPVQALAVNASGAVYVGGGFTQIGGAARSFIAKLSGSGTGAADPDWNPSANTSVVALALDASGAVYAGGFFSQIGGAARSRIAKLSGSGTGAADPAWNPSVNGLEVRALAVDTSGAVYVGGNFTQIGGALRSYIAKLSGSGTGAADPDWNPSANNVVNALAVDASGAVYAGGFFTQAGSASRFGIAKLSGGGTGAADPDWNPFANSWVYALTADASGAVYVGGVFTQIGGASRSYIAKLSGSGTGVADPDWNPSASGGVLALANGGVLALALDTSGTVVAGGIFGRMDGQLPALARLDASGALAAVQANADRHGSVATLATQPNGGLIVGGSFYKADGQSRGNLLRLLPDHSLDPDWNPSANGQVSALAVDTSGAVYAGGYFSQIGGATRNNIARLSGSGTGAADPAWNPSANSTVFALALDGSGAVYAGGFFSQIGGASRSRIAKLSGSGSGAADQDWNPSANGFEVRALVVDVSGAVYVGGNFTHIGGSVRSNIAKLSGSGTGAADPAWNPSANSGVQALAVDGSGAVYAGGNFTQIGGASRILIAKLSGNGTGAADPGWNPSANGTVAALTVDASGAVYAGGFFSQIGGTSRSRIARLSGSGTGAADPGWYPSANGAVNALALGSNGVLFAGGGFSQISGQPRVGLAALPVPVVASSDADLLALQPSAGSLTPAFDPEQTQYSVQVDNAIGALTLTPTASDAGATIRVNGVVVASGATSPAISLAVGLNPILVAVTAADGVTGRSYQIDATRLEQAQVDLRLTIQRLHDGFAKSGAELRRYRIVVTNVGTQAASAVQLNVPIPRGLFDLLWTCEAPGGCQPAEGENAVVAVFDLGSGQSAEVELSGLVDESESFVELGASVSGGGSADSLVLIESGNGAGIHKSGFENETGG